MAVREFNGTSDDLVQNLGAATSLTYGTAAMLLKYNTVTGFRSLFQFHDSTYTFVSAPLDTSNFSTFSTFYSTGSDTGFTVSTGIWYLVVIRKATGTSTPRYSVYNYNTSSWTHGNSAGGAEANATATGAGGRSGFAFQGSQDFFGGRVAMRAAWTNSLPWTADASGDPALVAAGLHTSAANWVSNNPSVCWKYDQASTATAVVDISSGGTGTQISITGTTVVNGDDPPGFDFTLGGAASPAVQLQYWPALRGGPWPRPQKALGDLPVVATTNAPADVATATATAPFDTTGGSISLNLIADNPVVATGTAFDATVSTANTTNASAGLASGTGTANGATVKVSPSPTLATATGTANNPTIQTGSFTNAAAGLASGTGTANNPTIQIAPVPGVATATGTANTTTSLVNPGPSTATSTGTAQTPSPSIQVSPTTAAATGTAYNATIQTGSATNAQAGQAAATGTAQNTTSKVSPTPGTSTATGTANNATVQTGSATNAAAGAATATGSANNATVTRTANAQAGVAAATGSVSAVSLGVRAAAEAAVALAAALAPAAGAFLPGTAHAATGAAPTASAAAAATVSASAGAMTVPTATGG